MKRNVLIQSKKNSSNIFRLLLIGQFGLKNKREVWRVQYILTRIRKAARDLLMLEETDSRRVFEGEALIKRMQRIGVLGKDQNQLDYVLGLTTKQFLERRLQTIVFQSKNARSIHEARALIFQKKIGISQGIRRKVINIPSFIVRTESENSIQRFPDKEYESRTQRRTKKRNEEKAQGDGADEE